MTARWLATIALVIAVNLSCSKPIDRDGKPITSGTFRLRTFPSGARVWIDGELKVPATPATLVLEQGTYHLKMQADGAEALEKDIEIEAGVHKDFTYTIPRPPPATLTVTSDYIGAKVRINGYVRGRTPLEGAVTNPGPIDITVTTPDGRAKSVRDQLAISEQKRIEVFFAEVRSDDDKPVLATQSGLLTIAFRPEGNVLDDTGQSIGTSPIQGRRVEAGPHALTLRSADGRYERHVRVVVEAGKDNVFRFNLGPQDLVEGRDASP